LVARNLILTADDFIELAATKSSFSGIKYQVKCPGSAATSSSLWLTTELLRLRAL
jgi:hypothetical protein